MKISMRQKWIAGGMAVLFLAAAVFALAVRKRGSFQTESEAIKTAAAEIGDVVDMVRVRGKIAAAKKVPIFSEANGQVIKLHVTQGQEVRKGDILLEIDQTQMANNLERQRMNLEKTQITLHTAEKDYNRKEALFEEKYVSEAEYQEAKKILELARLDYSMAQKELDALNEQMGKVKVIAPLSGVITQKNVEEGQVISGVNETSAQMLFMITDTARKSIEVFATETELSALRLEKEVIFWIEAAPGVRYRGTVSKVDAAAVQTDTGTSSSFFRVEVRIPEENTASLMLGANTIVEVVAEEAKNVLRIPVEGLFRENEQAFVFVKTSKGAEKRPVIPGVSNTAHVEIKEGIKNGESIFLEDPL